MDLPLLDAPAINSGGPYAGTASGVPSARIPTDRLARSLHAVASDLFRGAGAPPEALVPLMQRTIENDFELTGPIDRGDWETVEAHRRAIRAARPGAGKDQ